MREADCGDAASCAAIYAPYVRETATTFELDPPTEQEMAARIAAARDRAWWVAELDGGVVGYAYAGPFATRAAYRWTCEASVYVDHARRGQGAGRTLYRALLDRLTDRGFQVAVARIALPNEPSLALHRSFGFIDVGGPSPHRLQARSMARRRHRAARARRPEHRPRRDQPGVTTSCAVSSTAELPPMPTSNLDASTTQSRTAAFQ